MATYNTESEYEGHYNGGDDELDTQNDTLGTTRTGIATLSGTEIVTSNTRSTDDGDYDGYNDGDDYTDVSRITLPIDPPARGDGHRVGFGNNYHYDSRRRLGVGGVGAESSAVAMVVNDIEDSDNHHHHHHHQSQVHHHHHHSSNNNKKKKSNKKSKSKKKKSTTSRDENSTSVLDGFDVYTWWGFVAVVVIGCIFIYFFVSNY